MLVLVLQSNLMIPQKNEPGQCVSFYLGNMNEWSDGVA